MRFHAHNTPRIEGTTRIELFSDAVFAIVATLLILEVKVPHLQDPTSMIAVYRDMLTVLPHFISFAFSFVVLCIYWVNHHHFYHQLTHADWPLLWHNCNLLFWLCIVPFTTAFVGEYPTVPLVISLYAFVLCMAALAFLLMARHAFFHADLSGGKIQIDLRKKEYSRILPGVLGYAFAAIAAFFFIWLAWAALVFVPLLYFVPRLAHSDSVDEV